MQKLLSISVLKLVTSFVTSFYKLGGIKMLNIEREFSTEEAKKFALNWVKEQGYTYEEQKFSTNDHKFKIYRGILKKGKEVIAVGNGKGLGDEPLVGAIFETIEHFYYNSQRHREHIIFSTQNLKRQLKSLGVNSYPINLLHSRSAYVQVDKFLGINNNESFYYPCVLNDVNFKDNHDDNDISGYRSDNGYAIGATKKEAVLHALNEVIERDSISKVLIRYGLGIYDDCDCWEVDKKTLPYNIRVLIGSIEKTSGTEVRLIRIRNVYSIPTILCVSKGKKWKYPLYGAGTSLDLEYATIRAVTELLQLILLFGKEDQLLFERLDKQWKGYNLIKRMLRFEFLSNRPIRNWNYRKGKKFHKNVDGLIAEEVSKLERCKRRTYVRDIYEGNGVYVVQVIVPGTELFNLILEGSVLLPCNYYGEQ